MKLTFVNHASFIIEHNDFKIICDPWLDGCAFNNGWKLLSETKMKYSEFESITHIWFSHEHPDHFSPPNLLKIPKEIRSKITVLFQETTDRKVAKFCEKVGFKNQIELKENEYYEIGKDVSIQCNPYTEGDSYALFKIKDFKILNLNDCIVDTDLKAKKIAEKLGEVDLLFTQFSYANKIGNVDDIELRKKVAKGKLERIRLQNKYLKPKKIIPFASFVYFCHQENSYMNNGINKIDTVHDFIVNELKTECMVMYPEDSWVINEQWDSSAAIEKYLSDYENINNHFLKSKKVSEQELIDNSIEFVEKIKNGYPKRKRFINSMKSIIYVSDLNMTFKLSGKKGLKQIKSIDEKLCDISIGSDSLNYCFKEL